MPKSPNTKKEENTRSSKNIEIPPIPKQTAGAVAGAAAGSIAGPIGAVVGGVVGAIAGKAAEKRRPIAPAATRSARSLMKGPKAPRRQPPRKRSVAKQRKTRTRYGRKAKRLVSHRSTTTRSGKGSGTRRRSQSSRAGRKRTGGRTKQH
jgi:hypothetical protein